MEYVLVTNALSKRYGNYKALENLSMHVPKGSIYGVVGKNGAGKTTLIRLICGLQKPTFGNYTLYGVANTNSDILKEQRKIGAVVETPSIYLDLTATDNLKQQCSIIGLPSFDAVPDLLKFVGLENAGKKKVKNFSLGMRQRLGIAVALIGSPDLLILDEPTNGLDPQGIIEIRELILKLNREKQITIMISSHILDELSRLATHYGFIDKGVMIKEITAKELEASCQKRVELVVSDIEKLSIILDKMEYKYDILSNEKASIYGEVPISQLSLELSKIECDIISMHDIEESLESYYINLIGGGKYE